MDDVIWRAAHLLIKNHGGDAAFIAAQRADSLILSGNPYAGSLWINIFRAIEELERQKPHQGEAVN